MAAPLPRRPGAPRPPASNPCAAVGCQHLVQRGFLMCNDHWRQVPTAMRKEVWDSYRLLGRHIEAPQRYGKAVLAAVEAVHTKQLKRKAKGDAGSGSLF